MTASAIGAGAVLLRLAGAYLDAPAMERAAWSFVFGTGALGWLGFFAALGGHLSPFELGALCLVFVPGLFFLRGNASGFSPESLDAWGWILLAGIGLSVFGDLLEGLAPPADADTLAYHFAIPKLFLSKGGIEFIPRAGDGAIPLLQQMTYMIVLGIGGEQATTLWTMLSGWGASALVFFVARRHVGINWSMAVTLIFMTTPAVIYGAGSGHVEV
ncbi:MAG: hypothetical protein OEY85_01155, partial [Rhodospirillales bacterium]|nr:hypothetical protein [Rhodospirillales bacterium]